jgi:hypothetical protein
VQRATAQSKTGMFRDYGVAEAPPGFQAIANTFFLNSYFDKCEAMVGRVKSINLLQHK